jgi:hypothetical protein
VKSCASSGEPAHPYSLIESFAKTRINPSNGDIGASVAASATGGYRGSNSGAPAGEATAITRWYDTVYLNGQTTLPGYLNFEFSLDGYIDATFVDDGVGSSNDEVIFASLSVLGGPSINSSDACFYVLNTPNPWSIYPYQPSLCPPERTSTVVGDIPPLGNPPLTINHYYPLTNQFEGAYDFNYQLYALASATSGYSISDFVSTLDLKAIYLPDGSTPESQGWDLVFASGIRSPNISAPPPVGAPSPIPLVGLGACFAWSRKIRRRIRESQED